VNALSWPRKEVVDLPKGVKGAQKASNPLDADHSGRYIGTKEEEGVAVIEEERKL